MVTRLLTYSFQIKCIYQFCYESPHSFQEKMKKNQNKPEPNQTNQPNKNRVNNISLEITILFFMRTTS